MSFQTDDLTMLALGILGDAPVDPAQPPLPDGIHLRWVFEQTKGFPLHGFYLFRRESRPTRPVCLSPLLGDLRPGSSRSTRLETRLGRLSSPQALVWTDDFPASGTVEAGGRHGLRFDLPPGVEARQVEVKIGFRDAEPQVERKCVDFRRHPIGFGPNPRLEGEVDFDVRMDVASGSPIGTSIEAWKGGLPGLNSGHDARITLPCPASRVDLLLTSQRAMRIEALNGKGEVLMSRELRAGELLAGTVQLEGAGIAQLYLSSESADSALLHEICYECLAADGPAGRESAIEIRALSGKSVVAQTTVRGTAGQVVSGALQHEGITAVEIAPGPAALVDLCYVPSKQGVTFGWGEVPGFQYPLCLPVADKDYLCPGKPATFEEAETLAFSRVTYRAPEDWNKGFKKLHDELVTLVQGGSAGGSMAGRTHPDLPGHPLSPATQSDVPKIPGLRPLDLILLASLHPAVAQMLGLYFVDQSVAPDLGYDFLLLADPTGVLGGSAETALAWLAFTPDASKVDATLVPDRRKEPRPPIAPPGAPRAYALPGMATRAIDGTVRDVVGNVGLSWPLPADSDGQEEPGRILFYYPRRASLGTVERATQPALTEYEPIPDLPPVLVSEPDVPPASGPPISDWPPPSAALHVVDANLLEGWYSYRLAGQDLFGRRSSLGPPSEWYQWDPPQGTAAPWYYELPAGHRQIHSFAVALLDKIPPPTPLGVEAWTLDPLDQWALVDEPYTEWRKENGNLIGLRVRWRWTLLQQIQAPDTREFRIYYQPGRWNALLGKTVKVTAPSTTESDVELDFASSHPPDRFAGTRLRVGNDDFAVLRSQPGVHLRLRVKNIGVKDEVRPAEGKPCTVAIPEKHKLWVDTALATTWAKRLAHVPYDPPARTVVDPSKDANGRLLTNEAFAAAVTVNGKTALLPLAADLSGIQPWVDHLWLEDGDKAKQTHRILGYDAEAATVTLETAPTLGPPVHWIVGRPAREYDVFLPAPDVGEGNPPFEPSLAEPTVFAQIAVSAADDKKHVDDDPKWSEPATFGNESQLTPSATIYRVRHKAPEPPELVERSGPIFATPADYHNRSYFTFRFVPQEHLRVHILRALDESLFRRDWLIRETRTALDPVPDPAALDAKTEHLEFFPDGWGFSRRKAASEDIKALAGAPYELSDDAWAVLVLLPGNEGQPDRPTLEKRDLYMRRLRGELAESDIELFPNTWNKATREEAAKVLNKITDPDAYRLLSDDALRVLAALPGNEAAFTQITLQPLDMADKEIEDQRRPDDDASYTPKSDRRAYMDTLPGRATNRYFYRASFVDGAQNQSALSLPGLPVYLHKVEPPRTPVITKVIGGNRMVTLRWAPNREPDLVGYSVYRTDDAAKAHDIRFMDIVASVPPGAAEPALRGAYVEWMDADLLGGTTVYYRIVAEDSAGNRSTGSGAKSTRVVDTTVPDSPSWGTVQWVLLRTTDGGEEPWPGLAEIPPDRRPAIRLEWHTTIARPRFTLTRTDLSDAAVRPILLDGLQPEGFSGFVIHDQDVAPADTYQYAIQVTTSAGVPSRTARPIIVPPVV